MKSDTQLNKDGAGFCGRTIVAMCLACLFEGEVQ